MSQLVRIRSINGLDPSTRAQDRLFLFSWQIHVEKCYEQDTSQHQKKGQSCWALLNTFCSADSDPWYHDNQSILWQGSSRPFFVSLNFAVSGFWLQMLTRYSYPTSSLIQLQENISSKSEETREATIDHTNPLLLIPIWIFPVVHKSRVAQSQMKNLPCLE